MIRKIWLSLCLLLFLFTVTACGDATSSDDQGSEGKEGTHELTVVDWGGGLTEAHKKTTFEPFEEKFNVKIHVESPTNTGKLKAMVEAGNVTWDVVNVGSFWAAEAAPQDLLEPLDFDIIDTEDIVPELVTDYSVGAEMYYDVIAYNTDVFPTGSHPKNWAEFWDTEKFPGPRAIFKDPHGPLEAALMADGVPIDELYPLDVERAFKKMDELRSNTEIIWWTAGAQPAELLSTGSAAAAFAWNGQIELMKLEGAPIDVEHNQSLTLADAWVVPKGAKNKDLAMEFINFATSAEIQADLGRAYYYAPVNTKGIEMLSDEEKAKFGLSGGESNQVPPNDAWWAENYEEINQRFQEWLLE